jgi:hypothetical protein
MLAVDLKRGLNSHANAIRRKAVKASSTSLKVIAACSPLGSVMPRIAGGDPWKNTVVFEVVTT